MRLGGGGLGVCHGVVLTDHTRRVEGGRNGADRRRGRRREQRQHPDCQAVGAKCMSSAAMPRSASARGTRRGCDRQPRERRGLGESGLQADEQTGRRCGDRQRWASDDIRESARGQRGGRILVVGNTSGPLVKMDLRYLFAKQISIIGSSMGPTTDFSVS